MEFNRGNLDDNTLLNLYKGMLKPRLIEEKMLLLLRKGQVSKWFSGIGQEAISVGATMGLEQDEYVLPLHRNLGVFTSRGINLQKLFAQLEGKQSGYSQARERSFHFGVNEYHIVGMISHLGPQLSVGAGIALGHLLNKDKKVSLAFTGEGGTSEGEFHEALNMASVWNLPVIFLIENNGYGLSTPVNEQYHCRDLVNRAVGYGMKGYKIDGNNILEVYQTISLLAERMRNNPEPVLVECITFRMRGHEEASGTKYVPQELFEEWGKKDPLNTYEAWLLQEKLLDKETIEKLKADYLVEINEALEIVLNEAHPVPDTQKEINAVYAPFTPAKETGDKSIKDTHDFWVNPKTAKTTKKRLVDAVSDALRQSMVKYPNLILMGQDIAEYGGVFKVTEGFVEEFGKARVRNTPICESAVVGIGLGLSVKKYKAMVEMQFADFVTCGFNQIINNLAKIYYRWGQNADVVIRMPTGAGVGAGPFHSQSNEAWFVHTPGLKVVYPSTPMDAKGLLNAAIEDPNPVMFFEHKALYRSTHEEIYDDYYTIEIGKARRVQDGDEISIITYGAGVQWAVDAAEKLHISADIIDLRTLLPWDKEMVLESVKKTGKALVLHEDCLTGGIGGEIAATIAEEAFTYLDAPVMRLGSLDTPVPFAPELEANFLAKARLEEKMRELVEY